MEIILNAVDLCVYLVAAVNNLYVEVCCFLRIKSSFDELILAILSCVERVKCVAEVDLLKVDLVCNALLEVCGNASVIDNRKLGSKAYFNCRAVLCLDGSCECVLNLCLVEIGKVDRPHVCLGAFLDLDVLIVSRPSYVEGNLFDDDLSNNVVVIGKCLSVLVLHNVVEVILCLLKSNSTVVCLISASGKYSYTHQKCEKECQKLFHCLNLLLYFVF